MADRHVQAIVQALEASVKYFGTGDERQKARDRWVAERFLRVLRVPFHADDLQQPDHSPIDVAFVHEREKAAFQMKEVQDPGRRRHHEYKQRLAKARAAGDTSELLEAFTPVDTSFDEVCRVVTAAAADAFKRYPTASVRRALDLVVYVNLQHRMGIDDPKQPPDLSALIAQGWRSVSFLCGAMSACVLIASADAPKFLRAVCGKLVRSENFDE